MATLADDAMLIGIWTPYRKAGLLYKKFRDHYGEDGDILVVKAPSIALNPTLDQAIIDQAFEDDPAEAAAEWNAEFRADIAAYVDRDVIEGCVEPRQELSPMSGVHYYAYMDPAGGSGADAMTLAITHTDKDGYSVLDVARERRPPFSPTDVVDEYAKLMKAYRVRRIVGDHWGGEFVRQPFREHGIEYEVAALTASDTYRDALPLFNSGKAKLYDLPRLLTQLCNLERTTSRTGKDTISHPKRQHDDLANAVLRRAAARRRQQQVDLDEKPPRPDRSRACAVAVRAGARSFNGRPRCRQQRRRRLRTKDEVLFRSTTRLN